MHSSRSLRCAPSRLRPIFILAVGSFVYGLITVTTISEKHAFYMPMARFWEIAVGGCVAAVERRWGLVHKVSDLMAILGLLAIAAAVTLLESSSGGQQWAVVAVLGTAAVIAAGAPSRSVIAAALGSRPMVGIGRISYSMYLVHWPLIVFWRLCVARPLVPHEQVLILILTIGLAAALSAFVETPMRAGSRQIGNKPALAGILTASTVVAALGTAVILDRGAVWRMSPTAREALATLRAGVAERPRCIADKQWLGPGFSVCRWNAEVGGTDFVIWGDSHAGALGPELARVLGNGGKRSGVSVGIPGCSPVVSIVVAGRKYSRICPVFVDAVIKAIAREKPKIVVIAARWAILASDVPAAGDGQRTGRILDLENNRTPMRLADALSRTLERVHASGGQVVLVGPVPEIDYDVPPTLVRSLHGIGRLRPVRRADFDMRQAQVLSALAKIQASGNVSVVYPHTVLCNAETCAVADGIRSLYMDDDHLSPFGSARVSWLVRSAIDWAEKMQDKPGTTAIAEPDYR